MTGVPETLDAVDIAPNCGRMQKGRLSVSVNAQGGGAGVLIPMRRVP